MDDWEMLHGSDTESIDSITSVKNSGSSSLIDDGMIVSDHFSAENLSQFGVIESGDCDSDSSRVDYGSDRRENQVADLGFDQFGVYDSKSGTLDDGEVKLSDFEADDVAEVNGGNLSHDGDASKCLFESDNIEVVDNGRNVESESGVEEPIEDSSKCFSESDDVEEVDNLRHVESLSGVEEPIEDLGKSWSDSGGNELVSGDSGSVNGEEEVVSDSVVASTEAIEGNGAVRCGDDGKSREIVWWKMPFVLLKYYTFRIGPVWSVSMAAAVMGLVLLGRRLYNMKKKAQRFHLKVTIDDKKASRVMSQAARLNEVFTEVRRVPVIRPALPSPGAWPVLSLR